MPRTASSFTRSVSAVCRAIILVALLAPVTVVPRASAQATPDPSHRVHGLVEGHHGHHHHIQPAADPDETWMKPLGLDFAVQAIGTANMSGGLEVPGPGDPDGFGTAQVRINVGTQEVCVALTVQNIAAATAAHIHRGATGVDGPIVVTLPTPVGGVANGCVPVNPILAREIIANPSAFYVNVHTGAFPNGAIRGQVVLTQPTNLQATLSGAAEVPPADPDGSGLASVSVDLDTQRICAVISVANIAAATLAHIHQGTAGMNGGIVVDLPVPTPGGASGCTNILNAALLQNIVNNPAGFYVNIHNGDFPDGALRGQLAAAPPITHVASFSGAAEVPGPGDPDGTGLSLLTVDVGAQRICVTTLVMNIAAATMAHIHSGVAGMAGGIVVTLPTPVNGSVTGCVDGVNPMLIAQINSNPAAFYVNVHTGDFPDGALRGQLAAIAAAPPQADLQLVDKVDIPDPVLVGTQLSYILTVRNNGPAPATTVTLTDVLPAGVQFVSASAGCIHAMGTVTCNLGALGNGSMAVVNIVVTPTALGAANNAASVTSATADPTPGNNAVQASTTVQNAPCTQRPPVRVQTQVVTENGVPRLRATVTPQTSVQVPVNVLMTSIQFTQVDDARVTVLPNGPVDQTAPFTHPLQGTPAQFQFDVFRRFPGVTATVRFTANDACGPWPSTVGAGPRVPI